MSLAPHWAWLGGNLQCGILQKGGRIERPVLYVAELWDGLLVSLVSVSSADPARRKHSANLSLWVGQGEKDPHSGWALTSVPWLRCLGKRMISMYIKLHWVLLILFADFCSWASGSYRAPTHRAEGSTSFPHRVPDASVKYQDTISDFRIFQPC